VYHLSSLKIFRFYGFCHLQSSDAGYYTPQKLFFILNDIFDSFVNYVVLQNPIHLAFKNLGAEWQNGYRPVKCYLDFLYGLFFYYFLYDFINI